MNVTGLHLLVQLNLFQTIEAGLGYIFGYQIMLPDSMPFVFV